MNTRKIALLTVPFIVVLLLALTGLLKFVVSLSPAPALSGDTVMEVTPAVDGYAPEDNIYRNTASSPTTAPVPVVTYEDQE